MKELGEDKTLDVTGADGVLVVAIGGFDPSGGAGVVRDYATARSLGAAIRLVPTAWTEQSSAGVSGIEARSTDALRRAIRGAIPAGRGSGPEDRGVVLKIGMLPNPSGAHAVAEVTSKFTGPMVFDPVLSASSGGALYEGDPGALWELAAQVTILTPNAVEAEILAGVAVRTLDDAARAGEILCARGARAVLVKGGHLGGVTAVDVLVTRQGARRLEATRLPGRSVRGTGCALATSIAVGLGRGLAVGEAVAEAKAWLHDAIARAVDVGGERHLT